MFGGPCSDTPLLLQPAASCPFLGLWMGSTEKGMLRLTPSCPASPSHHLPCDQESSSSPLPLPCYLLAQMTWPSLRAEFPALSPAQLHRVLSQCQAVMDVGCIAAWQPGEEESPATFQPGEPLASQSLLQSPAGSL